MQMCIEGSFCPKSSRKTLKRQDWFHRKSTEISWQVSVTLSYWSLKFGNITESVKMERKVVSKNIKVNCRSKFELD